MSNFGVEIVSVEVPGAGHSAVEVIQNAIADLLTRVPSPTAPNDRGILRFPPARYEIESPLIFPAGVVLRFDPGALLVIGAGVTLSIQSVIDAGLQQIFSTASLSARPSTRPFPLGQVLLLGTRNKRVLPEWWGAGRGNDDTEALQSAIYAAHTDRVYTPDDASTTPIPLELTGHYRITRSLKITYNHQLEEAGRTPTRAPSPEAPPFIVRGVRTTESATQNPVLLWAAEGARSADAMVWSDGSNGLQVQNLSMDGQLRVAECLHVQTSQSTTPVVAGSAQMILIRECSFSNATQALLHIGDAVSETGGQDLPSLTVQQCVFKVSAVDPPDPSDSPFMPPGANGIRLNASQAVGVYFRDCVFSGQAAAFIHAYGGAFTADGCVFNNRYQPRMVGGRLRYGCDVLMDRHIASNNDLVVPASMIAIDCESSSVQVIDSSVYQRADVPVKRAPSTGNSMLINFKHRRFMQVSAETPAVFWGQRLVSGPAQAPTYPLTLLGCWLDGPVHMQLTPAVGVIDLGTTFTAEGDHFFTTDSDGGHPTRTRSYWSLNTTDMNISFSSASR